MLHFLFKSKKWFYTVTVTTYWETQVTPYTNLNYIRIKGETWIITILGS